MANTLYAKAKEKFLAGTIDMVSDTIKVCLIDTNDYTPNFATHEFFSSVAGAAVVASATLTSKSITNGVFDAADVTFNSVTGDQCEALLIYADSGSAATSPLIALIDTTTGLPITPNGSSITVQWNNGSSKIFTL